MRKQLGAPDEERKKAKRLFNDELFSEKNGSDFDEEDRKNENLVPRVRLSGGKTQKRTGSDATAYAMKLLAMRAYNEHGLREKLKKREFSEEEADAAVEYVRGFGYLNDSRLAQNAAEKAASKLWGRKKIYLYLRSRGFSVEIIDGIDFSEIDFKENCRILAQKYAAKGAQREKIMAALSRAGFSISEIYTALDFLEQ